MHGVSRYWRRRSGDKLSSIIAIQVKRKKGIQSNHYGPHIMGYETQYN